jgi:hypothetical protein
VRGRREYGRGHRQRRAGSSSPVPPPTRSFAPSTHAPARSCGSPKSMPPPMRCSTLPARISIDPIYTRCGRRRERSSIAPSPPASSRVRQRIIRAIRGTPPTGIRAATDCTQERKPDLRAGTARAIPVPGHHPSWHVADQAGRAVQGVRANEERFLESLNDELNARYGLGTLASFINSSSVHGRVRPIESARTVFTVSTSTVDAL